MPLLYLALTMMSSVQCCRRAYDYNPFPIIEAVIDKCNLRSQINWECNWNVRERITCHSCILENIRVKCPRLPDYVEWTEELHCRRLRECIYSLDFRKCYG